MVTPLWKVSFVPASFRMVPFHIESGNRNSGRRVIVHEFPKRDTPYAEDMGLSARRFSVTGYVIGPNYMVWRDALILALELETPGILTLPTMMNIVGTVFMVQPLQYSVREQRTQGGMAQFEMNFVEAGNAGFDTNLDTQSNAQAQATNTETQTNASSSSDLKAIDDAARAGGGL